MGNTDTPPGTDIGDTALEQYLADQFGPAEAFEATEQDGGSSNRTVFVRWGARELVLRCAPEHERVPYLLHDVLGEYEMLSVLGETAVPVPQPVASCADTSVLGVPFYLMERVHGEILGGEEPARFATPQRRQRVGEAMIDTLASLHTVEYDPSAVREVPEGTTAEAVEAHVRNLEDALETTGRRLGRALEVGEWLREHVPEPPERTLVHGDYKPDNTMMAPTDTPRIAAVLDWEMAGVGNPRADLGWLLNYWSGADDPDPITPEFEERYGDHELYGTVAEYTRHDSTFMAHPAYPSRAELVDRYEHRTGIEYRHDRFYRALGLFKLMTICERFYEAYLESPGTAKDTYPMMELIPPVLAERAALVVDGEARL
jgi:aminoglycoside phosphotransferase (APT) family kinase protein